jgi:hypothetical protein
MAIIKCEYVSIVTEHGGQRLRCVVVGSCDGQITITSQLKMVDFERKMAITQNNIYRWE